jgi:RNA polymerase sigma-70 factor (ECF subfamily)
MHDLPTIAALKQEDEIVFRALFHEYHEKVYHFILSRSHSAYIAEETTQLTFIKLWNYRHSLDESVPLAAQIFRIAKTVFIDLLRKELHQSKLTALRREQATPEWSDTSLQAKQLQQQLALAINSMPPVRKKVFQLSRHHGLSHKEISQALSLSVKTVETHIALALKQLKHLFFLLLWVITLFF